MIKARVIIRMDSGNLLKSSWLDFEDAIDDLNNIQSEIERNCAEGSDFLFASTSVICISKIESIYIQTKEFDDD